jgi:rubrerythrin
MQEKKFHCQRTCRNSCASLNEALRKETTTVRFYEGVFEECNVPDVRNFLDEIIEGRREEILKIIQKLNEIHVRSQAMDGISSSFGI